MNKVCGDNPADDVRLVTETYERCGQRSRGRYNSWVEGRLDPLARRFYIVVNATERCLMGGVPSLLADRRFTLAETAEAYESFRFADHAAVVRELAALVNESNIPCDRCEHSPRINHAKVSAAETDRLNKRFPMSKADENEVWRRLATIVREQPQAFAAL